MQIKPLVSICCTTYNHAKYITEAIEGFLLQQTSFPIEIIIHDDASTDETANIVRNYENKYPKLFRCIYQKENQLSKGIKPWTNFIFPIIRGKYIAICEGDDYWTDPFKLQKQFDFLERESKYAICFHNARLEFTQEKINSTLYNINYQDTYSFKDLIFTNPIATATCFFRNNLSLFKPGFENQIMFIDDNWHLLNAQFGLIKFLNEVMSVYRIHTGGSWSQLDLITKAYETVKIKHSAYQYFKAHHQKKYFRQSVGISYFNLADAYTLNRSYFNFFKFNSIGLLFLLRGKRFSIKRLMKYIYAISPKFFRKKYSSLFPILYNLKKASNTRIFYK